MNEIKKDDYLIDKSLLIEIQEKHDTDGFIYVTVTRGDWLGSIAKFKSIDYNRGNGQWCHTYGNYAYRHGTLSWDGRKNSKKVCLGYEANWLKDYEGPTVFKKIDRKAIAKKANTVDRFDINGVKLEVGDHVLYINTRYGGGSQLNHGTIESFSASQSGETFTNVKFKDGDQMSKISSSRQYIYKMKESK